MSSTPNITRHIFDASKRYYGVRYQPNQFLYDWDVNETSDELRWFTIKTADALAGGSGRLESGTAFGLQPSGVGSTAINLTGGSALVNGRLVQVDSGFDYEDSVVNYIVRGTLTTVDAIIAGSSYNITDEEKLFSANYSLPGCRLVHVPTGNEYLVTALNGQQVVVSGDLDGDGVLPGDAYRLAPPDNSTIGTIADPYSLVTWFEDTSGVEDSDLLDPITNKEPSHRSELRWCVHRNWLGASTSDALSGHSAVVIFTVDMADTTINPEDVTDGEYIRSLSGQDIPNRMVQAESDIDTLEDKVSQVDRVDAFYSFKQEGFFSIEADQSKTLTLVDGKVVQTPFLPNKEADKYVALVDAGSVVNATTESSHFRLDVNVAGDGLDGDVFGSSVTQFDGNSTVIDDRQVNLLSIESSNDAVDPLIKRAFPMLDMPLKQGMDWSVYKNVEGKFPLHVQPGQMSYGGKLYQNPDEYVLDDLRDSAFHMNGIRPIDSWTYVYAVTSPGVRSLDFRLDTRKPKWNGEHPSMQAMCIGTVYFTSLDPIRCTASNDTIFFTENFTAFVKDGSSTPISGSDYAWDVEPPPQASITGLEVTLSSAIGFTLSCTSAIDITSPFTRVITGTADGTPVVGHHVEMPCTGGEYLLTTASGEGSGKYKTLTFTFGHMPDNTSWRN